MQSGDPLSALCSGQPVPLSGWFAEPLQHARAEDLLSATRDHLRRPSIGKQQRFRLEVVEFISAFWCGRDVQASHANLLAVARDVCDTALLDLCYGQLQMAVRLQSCWPYLDRGFQSAANLLEPEDYFLVLKRHDLLREIPCSTRPAVARGLQSLLTEAAVIRRLTAGCSRRPTREGAHRDTLD
jgi:hypothetical protein